MVPAVDTPIILTPSNNDTFNSERPILIQWKWSRSLPVTNFHLCIGTKPGTWNRVDGELGLTDRFCFTPFPLPDDTNYLYIQLIYKIIVTEGDHTEEEAYRVGDVITLERATALTTRDVPDQKLAGAGAEK